MNDREKIQKYTTAFTSSIRDRVRREIGIRCVVHPTKKDGAVLEFILERGGSEKIDYQPEMETVNDVLKQVKQNLVSGDISQIIFSGTSISMHRNRIVVIKGEDVEEEWGITAAKTDLRRVFHLASGEER